MATAGHGDGPPLALLTDPRASLDDDDSHHSDADADTASESGSSYIGSAQPDTPVCPYQSSRFFEQECSRYFDCPTHFVERALSDQDQRDQPSVPDDLPAVQEAGSSPDSEQRRSSPRQMPQVHDEPQSDDASAHGPAAASAAGLSANPAHPQPLQDSQSPNELSQPQEDPVSSPTELSSTGASDGDGSNHSGSVLQHAHSSVAAELMTVQEALNVWDVPESRARDAPGTSSASPGHTFPPAHPHSAASSPISTSRGSRSRRPPEIPLPRWQPDAEVTLCPICNTQFNIFIRKHHCRKCGRVVCARCSPHRITIPHQYIVRPPGEVAMPQQSAYRGEGGIADFSAVAGGESVRLCNPCVPDPNTTPPQTQHAAAPFPRALHHRSQSASSRDWSVNEGWALDSAAARYHSNSSGTGVSGDSVSRSRSATVSSGPHGLPPRLSQGARTASRSSGYQSGPSTSRSGASMLRPHSFFGGPVVESSSSSQGGERNAAMNRPLPPAPPIPEEDECPVCHYELPSRELENFEALREAHINQCIASHSAYGGAARDPIDAAAHGTPPPRTIRRTGIFPYVATEKDCVDDAECTICLEEFQVGVSMARLECLCRFHRTCISAWFVDHPGRCPVHQHDSFGY